MAGKEKGAAAKFCSETGNEKAVYFHCTSYELNVSLSKTSKILQVMNMVSAMQMLGIFYKYSPKRQRKLEQSIAEIATESLEKKVKPLCETRWVERHTALYKSILHCLESILLNNDLNSRFDSHSVTEASGLRKQLRSSSFIVCFQSSKYLHGYTKGLSQQLQGSTAEIAQAYEMVSVAVAQLNDIRDDAASEFQNIFTKC